MNNDNGGIVLEASGYTYKCIECKCQNYIGPATATVICKECKAELHVRSLKHRRHTHSLKNTLTETEQLTLFPSRNGHTLDGLMGDDNRY